MELLEDRGHVVLDRLLLQIEVAGDLLVALPLGHAAEEIIGENFARFYTDPDRAAGLPALGLDTADALAVAKAKAGRR